MDYAHARVRLHFCKVLAWRGEFEMREGQAMAWQTLPVTVAPVLPGTLPVLDWFAAEQGFVGADLRRRGGRRYTEAMSWLDEVKWDANGLVPAIAQEVGIERRADVRVHEPRGAGARPPSSARPSTGAARAGACGKRARRAATCRR